MEMVANGAFPSDERLLIVAPFGQMVWTCSSQAAQASHHWHAQQVAVDLAGGAELVAAAREAGGIHVGTDGAIFELEKKPMSSSSNH